MRLVATWPDQSQKLSIGLCHPQKSRTVRDIMTQRHEGIALQAFLRLQKVTTHDRQAPRSASPSAAATAMQSSPTSAPTHRAFACESFELYSVRRIPTALAPSCGVINTELRVCASQCFTTSSHGRVRERVIYRVCALLLSHYTSILC